MFVKPLKFVLTHAYFNAGNMIELMLELPGGKATSGWLRKYGSMIKFYSCFGVCRYSA